MSSTDFVLLEMFDLKIISISLLYDVDHRLKPSEKPSENLLDTRKPACSHSAMAQAGLARGLILLPIQTSATAALHPCTSTAVA